MWIVVDVDGVEDDDSDDDSDDDYASAGRAQVLAH